MLTMKTTFLFVMSLLVLSGNWLAAYSQPGKNLYSNSFVGIEFLIPDGWYIAKESETKEMMQEGLNIMDLDDPITKKLTAQMPGLVLLMLSETPFSDLTEDLNRNISIAAIDASEFGNEVSSGGEYLALVKDGLKETIADISVSDIIVHPLGGEDFYWLYVKMYIDGIVAYMAQIARIHNNYLLILNVTAGAESDLNSLLEITNKNLRLKEVSDIMNNSPEGKSFRKKASLDISGSMGSDWSLGNILKKGGIILLILGAVGFFSRN